MVKEHDSVIFFNFRPDRAREITRAFCDDQFTGFERPFLPLTYVCFKDYDETIPNKIIAFEKEEIQNTFGEFLAKNGKKQLRLAGDRKVCPRDILLQRRRGGAQCGRSASPGTFPQGSGYL